IRAVVRDRSCLLQGKPAGTHCGGSDDWATQDDGYLDKSRERLCRPHGIRTPEVHCRRIAGGEDCGEAEFCSSLSLARTEWRRIRHFRRPIERGKRCLHAAAGMEEPRHRSSLEIIGEGPLEDSVRAAAAACPHIQY